MSSPRILVVDDSSYVRMAVGRALEAQGLQVVGYARNGLEAVEQNLDLEPDLVLLDLQMPLLNGVEAVRRIHGTRPVPILVFASMDAVGAELAVQALAEGALDVVAKPSTEDLTLDLAARVWAIVGAADHRRAGARAPGPRPPPRLVVVASSTGGPPCVESLLRALPADFPVPVVVAQHMPPGFTKSLAARLDALCALEVFEGRHGVPVGPGQACILPGGAVGTVQRPAETSRSFTLSVTPGSAIPGAKPNASALFFSALGAAGDATCAVVMTGMGADGADAVRALVAEGATVVAQDPAEAIISSMPNASIAAGAQVVASVARIPGHLQRLVGSRRAAT